jgi:hypothetical protein
LVQLERVTTFPHSFTLTSCMPNLGKSISWLPLTWCWPLWGCCILSRVFCEIVQAKEPRKKTLQPNFSLDGDDRHGLRTK